jgi:hypothetical protein
MSLVVATTVFTSSFGGDDPSPGSTRATTATLFSLQPRSSGGVFSVLRGASASLVR